MRHHAEGLRRLTKDDALVMQLQSDFRRAEIDEQDRGGSLNYLQMGTEICSRDQQTYASVLEDERHLLSH